MINCASPKDIWSKLLSLYGATTEDAKLNVWEKFYAFKVSERDDVALQIEKFLSIVKQLEESDEKPSDASVLSKLLSSLPERFSSFRMAWDSTAAAEKTLDTLIARLTREEKRLGKDLVGDGENVLALNAEALKLENAELREKLNSSFKKKSAKVKIEDLKKTSKCGICKQIGHWHRECPTKDEDDGPTYKRALIAEAYSCNSSALHLKTEKNYGDLWLADSGADRHMTYQRENFTTFEPLREEIQVKIAGNDVILATAVGTVLVQENVNGQIVKRFLSDVLFVPNLRVNLLSIAAVTDKGFSFTAHKDYCEIRDKAGKISSIGQRHGKLYEMNFKVVPDKCITLKKDLKTNQKRVLSHEHTRSVSKASQAARKSQFVKIDINFEEEIDPVPEAVQQQAEVVTTVSQQGVLAPPQQQVAVTKAPRGEVEVGAEIQHRPEEDDGSEVEEEREEDDVADTGGNQHAGEETTGSPVSPEAGGVAGEPPEDRQLRNRSCIHPPDKYGNSSLRQKKDVSQVQESLDNDKCE